MQIRLIGIHLGNFRPLRVGKVDCVKEYLLRVPPFRLQVMRQQILRPIHEVQRDVLPTDLILPIIYGSLCFVTLFPSPSRACKLQDLHEVTESDVGFPHSTFLQQEGLSRPAFPFFRTCLSRHRLLCELYRHIPCQLRVMYQRHCSPHEED